MGKQFHGEAANYPGAPKNFDPQNPYADGVAMIAQREHVVREKMVKVETSKVSLVACRLSPDPNESRKRNPTV